MNRGKSVVSKKMFRAWALSKYAPVAKLAEIEAREGMHTIHHVWTSAFWSKMAVCIEWAISNDPRPNHARYHQTDSTIRKETPYEELKNLRMDDVT